MRQLMETLSVIHILEKRKNEIQEMSILHPHHITSFGILALTDTNSVNNKNSSYMLPINETRRHLLPLVPQTLKTGKNPFHQLTRINLPYQFQPTHTNNIQ